MVKDLVTLGLYASEEFFVCLVKSIENSREAVALSKPKIIKNNSSHNNEDLCKTLIAACLSLYVSEPANLILYLVLFSIHALWFAYFRHNRLTKFVAQ